MGNVMPKNNNIISIIIDKEDSISNGIKRYIVKVLKSVMMKSLKVNEFKNSNGEE
jgi:hypothetical protein